MFCCHRGAACFVLGAGVGLVCASLLGSHWLCLGLGLILLGLGFLLRKRR